MNPSVLAFSTNVRTFARSRPSGTSASISSLSFTWLPLTFLPVGEHDILVELADLATTLTLLDQITAANWPEVTDLVPAAHTLMVCFDPLLGDRESLMRRIAALDLSRESRRSGAELTIPVFYDGEDLTDVAVHLGLTREEVIARHTKATYTVAFSGFAPGFAYMTCDDPLFHVNGGAISGHAAE